MQTTIYVISRKEIQVCNLQEYDTDTTNVRRSHGSSRKQSGIILFSFSILKIERELDT